MDEKKPNNLLKSIISRIEEHPLISSIIITLLLFFSTKIIFISCLESCDAMYFPTIFLLTPSEAWMSFLMVVGFIPVIIKFLVIFVPVFFIIKCNLGPNKKLVLLMLFAGLFIFAQSYVYYHFTEEGKYYTEYYTKPKEAIDSTLKKVEKLKTKEDVINYIEHLESYVETNCEETLVDDPFELYFKPVISLKDSNKRVYFNDNDSYYCEFQQSIIRDITGEKETYEIEGYYDCLKSSIEGTNVKFCFKNGQTTYIYVNPHLSKRLPSEINREFLKSYDEGKLITGKSYPPQFREIQRVRFG